MSRRLLLACCLLVALAGGTTGDLPFAERPYPEEPATLTAETAGEYAANYEEVRAWNRYVSAEWAEAERAGADYVRVECRPDGVERTDGGYRIELSCDLGAYVDFTIYTPNWNASYVVTNSTIRRAEG